MSVRDVLGKNILVEALVDSVYYPIFCAKTAEKVIEQDEIETTNVNSGSAREFVPGMSNAMISMTGLTRVNNADGRINIVYLMQQAASQQIFTLRTTLTANNGDVAVMTFEAFIRGTNWSKDVSMLSSCYVNWRICGGISYATTVPAPSEPVCEVQDPLYETLAEGATTVSNALLNDPDVVILTVARETLVYTQTTGSPGNMQFRHTGANIEFQNAGNPGGETIYILYKIAP